MATVFHKLVTVEEAIELIESALGGLKPLATEKIPVEKALGRVLAENVLAATSAPPFDRSTVDGYAVKAADLYSATEENPVELRVVGKADVGFPFNETVESGCCVEIATGAPIPRGANAVAMVEFTQRKAGDRVLIYRAVSPGENIAQEGSDFSVGDTILRKGTVVSPREIAVLSSAGLKEVFVYRKLRAAVFSTGNEVTPPGETLTLGKIYDVNGPTITSMLVEAGSDAEFKGILRDDERLMVERIWEAIRSGYDVIITSGSTSAGFGDVVYRVFRKLSGGNVLVHGLKIKPGKPTVVAVANGKLLVGLPGFPLSAMIVFQKLVKPLVETFNGRKPRTIGVIKASLAMKVEAGKGKLEMVPVQTIFDENHIVAYPLLGESGSTYILSVADGIIEVPAHREFIDEGEQVEVMLLSEKVRPSELVAIGSHCPGMDMVIEEAGIIDAKIVNAGSVAGWHSIKRGEADVAGTHLLDEKTGEYNTFMLEKLGLGGKAVLIRGYARKIGFVTQRGNPAKIRSFEDLLRQDVMMVNRIKGSGTRTYLDLRLAELGVEDPYKKINGYDYEVRTHTAVAAAVLHGRADVGITIEAVAHHYQLEFIPLAEEIYDFVALKTRLRKKAVAKFIETLTYKTFQTRLEKTLPGYRILPETGTVVSE